ncbi:MAG: hypothetical protein JWM91_4839 [Rhodospirillales bacterium]|nr:hypothetical protein [Rhodospirillales bacterium]
MNWEHRGELRADPGIAPGNRNIDPPKRRRSIWPSIAVVAAFAAFGGVIWFAYQNGRDASRSGVPPLVKADAAPVKVKPDDPGGQEIPFQDSTVYDRLNKNGQKPVVEKLLPPTETPVSRPPPADAALDPPLVDTPSIAPQGTLQSPVTQLPSVQGLGGPLKGTPGAPLPDAGSPTALAPLPGAIIAQIPPPPASHPAQPATPVKPAAPPLAKPATVTPPNSIAALISGAGDVVAAPKSAAAGASYRIQLSAVRNSDAVAGEWARLKSRFPELASLKNSSSKVDVAGKGTFYRVEAGPLDQAAAKSTCARLRGQGLGCIVVQH